MNRLFRLACFQLSYSLLLKGLSGRLRLLEFALWTYVGDSRLIYMIDTTLILTGP